MREIVIRPRAREDLIGIWRYNFEEWGEAQADRYLAEIEAGINQLQQQPQLGRNRDDVRTGYRSLRINQHILYYTLASSVIRIVRVLHAQMDPDRHL